MKMVHTTQWIGWYLHILVDCEIVGSYHNLKLGKMAVDTGRDDGRFPKIWTRECRGVVYLPSWVVTANTVQSTIVK